MKKVAFKNRSLEVARRASHTMMLGDKVLTFSHGETYVFDEQASLIEKTLGNLFIITSVDDDPVLSSAMSDESSDEVLALPFEEAQEFDDIIADEDMEGVVVGNVVDDDYEEESKPTLLVQPRARRKKGLKKKGK